MQTLSWYRHRLMAMSPQEIAWRIGRKFRNSVDRRRASDPRHLPTIQQIANGSLRERGTLLPADIDDSPPGQWRLPSEYQDALVTKADAIVRHRLSFFDFVDLDLGHPIRWNFEHKAARATPMTYGPDIDYRDHARVGDCKIVWEPNRHHQFVVLGRAYRATGDSKYAQAVVDQLESWLEQCPYCLGMNWCSPLELGIRLINWAWTAALIRPSGLITGAFESRWLQSVYLHMREITRKYSRWSSANNHLIGEAAGVYVASHYFAGLRHAAEWHRESRDILAREILAQTFEDGATQEQAFGYHMFVLQFFTIAAMIGRTRGDAFGPAYSKRLEAMYDFAAEMTAGGNEPPMYGDSDDGYVLDLGADPCDMPAALAIGAELFGRDEWRRAPAPCEPVFWLFGRSAYDQSRRANYPPRTLTSRAFEQSGHYLLQHGTAGEPDAVSVIVDCGALGFRSIAAHGHADALSIVLRMGGHDVLVDPGTYDYFSFPQWRRYFRTTAAHNTLVVDETDQSTLLGPFMWGQRARACCLAWKPTPEGGEFVGQHDGYGRLSPSVLHVRRVTLESHGQVLRIVDEVRSTGKHRVALYFHFGENCRVEPMAGNRWHASLPGFAVDFEFDSRLKTERATGAPAPEGGWVSRGYHVRVPSSVLTCRAEVDRHVELVTQITRT